MRMMAVLAGVMIAVVLAAGACIVPQGASQQADVKVSIDELSNAKNITRAITVLQGGVVTVTLGSNPTTGFSWGDTARISDQAVLQQTGTQFLTPEATGMVGVPGNQVWTFKALQKGTTTVSMEYSQPWAGGQKGVWTFQLTVTVQ